MNLIVVDDDKLVVSSLKTILESDPNIKVVATGCNGKEAIDLYKLHHPDILLMDIRMSEMDGLTAGKIIIENHADAKILFLTTFVDDEYIISALRIGVKGYILKQSFESIAPALEAVMMGQIVFGEEIVSKLPRLSNSKDSLSVKELSKFDINEKELEIFSKVAQGLSNKEIAVELFLSEGTVRNYVSIILEKLHLRDRTQLAIYWYKQVDR